MTRDTAGIHKIAVIGAGTMGSQIAQQCALHGFPVTLVDTSEDQLAKAVASNRKLLQRRVDKGTMEASDMEAALARVEPTTEFDRLGDAQFVIEAVFEDLDAKRSVFRRLADVCSVDAVLTSNSSTIPISRIVQELPRRDRACNMHFFHPVLVMRLVEIMRGPDTSDETVQKTVALARAIDREPVVINREIYGLIVNRILGAIKREAYSLVERGYATPRDIDVAVRLGLNHPMGPFELSDFSGLDIFYQATLQRYLETGDESWKPSPLLEEKVKAGHLGRKTGRGFYEYDENGRRIDP